MATLFALSGPDVGRSFEVASGAVLGRAPDCDVRLADRSVSRRHARLEEEGGRWFVVDLGSRNGVRVRGERVERAELSDLDELELGELALRFRTEAPAGAAALEPAAPRAAAPAPSRAPSPRSGGAGRDGGDTGLELEEEIDLDESAALAATAVRPAPGAAAPARAEVELSARELERARLIAASRRTGLLSSDLGQQPPALRLALALLALALAALLAYGVFLAVVGLRAA